MNIIKALKSWIYGGDILRTVGVVRGIPDGHGGRIELRIHAMKSHAGVEAPTVGLETVYRRLLGYQGSLVMLSEADAHRTIEFIQQGLMQPDPAHILE
jgi:hypothetical protein